MQVCPNVFMCACIYVYMYMYMYLLHIYLSPQRSLHRHDLSVPLAMTSMAQTRAFAIIGLSLWNQLIPSSRSTVLTDEPSASSFSQDIFSLGLSH